MTAVRGIEAAYKTFYRWVQDYVPELYKRIRPQLTAMNDSWRDDESYCIIKGKWRYLYRARGLEGKILDFMLSAKRDSKVA